jgi:hypothetical protein
MAGTEGGIDWHVGSDIIAQVRAYNAARRQPLTRAAGAFGRSSRLTAVNSITLAPQWALTAPAARHAGAPARQRMSMISLKNIWMTKF